MPRSIIYLSVSVLNQYLNRYIFIIYEFAEHLNTNPNVIEFIRDYTLVLLPNQMDPKEEFFCK